MTVRPQLQVSLSHCCSLLPSHTYLPTAHQDVLNARHACAKSAVRGCAPVLLATGRYVPFGNVPSAGIKQHTIPTQTTHTTATPFRPYCLAVAAVGVHSVEEVSEALLAAAPLAAAEAAAGFDKQIQRTDIFQTNNKRI